MLSRDELPNNIDLNSKIEILDSSFFSSPMINSKPKGFVLVFMRSIV